MTDRAEAPERLSDQLIELWASRPELQVGVPYRSMATEAARLAAQERDAAVAAALEEAIECVRFVAREGANIGAFPQLREVAMLELVERTLEEWGEHQAIGCIRALPRNVDALRKHEAKLLRERDKLYCTALISSGLTVDQIHTIASRFNDLRPADDPVRDEAARREGTT